MESFSKGMSFTGAQAKLQAIDNVSDWCVLRNMDEKSNNSVPQYSREFIQYSQRYKIKQ